MSFTFFIASKYIFSRKGPKFISFISAVTVLGIALGVATLILALSILRGFENTITNKVMDFDAHLQITSYTNIIPEFDRLLPSIKNELNGNINSINPFLSQLAIISNKSIKEGVNIKGINILDNWKGIKKDIIKGNFLSNDNENELILGKKLADKLFLKINEKVTLFALNNNKLPSPDNPPKIEKFVIKGIYESGMSAYDDINVYVSLNNAQKLFGMKGQISGIDIKINNIAKIDSTKNKIQKNLRYPNKVSTIYQTHRNIFTWIELQKKPIPIVLTLIIIVAVFNIIGTLLILALEKTSSLGLLRSIGAKRNQIIKIFLINGSILSVIGIFIGNLLAYILSFLQLNYNFISIPSSVYLMSSIPIQLSPIIFIGVSIITFLLCIASSIIPSFIASKIDPIRTLRFN
ncbi:MAG: hypothetical protein CO128_04120 [Ignavibacteriales bacterium CG_4_9_14_3_um_filter_30_11]|nr:MAG: hypothetical protein CO128_04120 [Ignavibacteriales bacterium CG_4_9_14_3_um_filter_30_11]